MCESPCLPVSLLLVTLVVGCSGDGLREGGDEAEIEARIMVWVEVTSPPLSSERHLHSIDMMMYDHLCCADQCATGECV